jgi:sortase A
MWIRRVSSWMVSFAMIGVGLALVASFFYAGSMNSGATNNADPGGFDVPKIEPYQHDDAPKGPKDKTLELTIPRMSQIEGDTVVDAIGDDERALKENAAIHLTGTGFPWEEEANVYIAGHPLGYPGTNSFLAFFNLNKLKKGDRVFVTDSEGKRYTYKVFEEFVVEPTDVHVIEPLPGKNILTLQTCTLPNYADRVIVRAELVDEALTSAGLPR